MVDAIATCYASSPCNHAYGVTIDVKKLCTVRVTQWHVFEAAMWPCDLNCSSSTARESARAQTTCARNEAALK
jgi:hypothetical protein